jgi:FkbM family methyltransferase
MASAVKQALYGHRGEPYRIAGRTLRFAIGTRPVRTKHHASSNLVNRYDALQILKFLELIKPGQSCFDIGGHSGECAILMAALAGSKGSVVCFEPDPDARRMLEKNILLNTDIAPITVEPFAITDRTGTAPFFATGGNANSSLAAVGSVKDATAFEVETQTLDTYVKRRCGSTPTIVKIDIEGAEIHALRGAGNLLLSDATFLVELHPYAWDSLGVEFKEFIDIIERAGREAVYLDQSKPVIDGPTYGTVLLRKKRPCAA